MSSQKICRLCGNPRPVLSDECPFCNDTSPVITDTGGWSVHTINLENKLPTVDMALERFHNLLEKLQGKGFRAVKVIHGHGSSGTGGKIRQAFRQAMDDGLWGEAIREVYYGEALKPHLIEYKKLIERFPSIKLNISRDMQGNPGITLLILEKNY